MNDGETFVIPYKVNRIEVKICSFGKTYDSATFELRRDETLSEDAIEIDLEWSPMVWKLMNITCSNGWQRVYR